MRTLHRLSIAHVATGRGDCTGNHPGRCARHHARVSGKRRYMDEALHAGRREPACAPAGQHIGRRAVAVVHAGQRRGHAVGRDYPAQATSGAREHAACIAGPRHGTTEQVTTTDLRYRKPVAPATSFNEPSTRSVMIALPCPVLFPTGRCRQSPAPGAARRTSGLRCTLQMQADHSYRITNHFSRSLGATDRHARQSTQHGQAQCDRMRRNPTPAWLRHTVLCSVPRRALFLHARCCFYTLP